MSTTAPKTFSSILQATLLEVCLAATFPPTDKSAKKVTEKAKHPVTDKELEDLIYKEFGSLSEANQRLIGNLFFILTGDKRIQEAVTKRQFIDSSADIQLTCQIFAIVKVTKNISSHDYTIGKCFLVESPKHGYAMQENGDTGDHLHQQDVSIPTKKEVEEYIEGLNSNQIQRVMREPLYAPIIRKALETPIS